MARWILTTIFTLFVFHPALAQDYPYDDFVPQLKKKKDFDNNNRIPVEKPATPPVDLDMIFGLNIQAGGTYTIIQNSGITTSAPGYTMALGFNWDMQKHPISLEVETGFQQNLMGTVQKYSAIPVKFSTFYWSKLSENSVIRVGIGSGLEFRMQNSDQIVLPTWTISMIYEYASFTFEPALQIMRIHQNDSFCLGAFYFGYRI